MLLQRQKTFGSRKVVSVTTFKNLHLGTSLLFELGKEENPAEPMAIEWEWVKPDGDPMPLDPKS